MNKLLIHEEPLQVLPSLAAKIGLNEAIMLQQIHYWLRKSKNIRDGKPWIYNTYAEWEKQFPWWSNRTIKRIVDNLRSAGLIETTSKYNKINIDQTLWYTINYEKLDMRELTESPTVSESDKVAQSDSATSAESDKMSLPRVTSCHNGSDKVAQSAPVAESDKLALPIPRDIQENTTRENSACAQPEAPQPATPSPLPLPAPSSTSTGDPLMDAAAAKFNRNGRVFNSWQAELNLRLAADKRVPLVNAIGKACGLTALMNGNDTTLREVHTSACWFYENNYETPEKVEALHKVYLSDDWRRKNHPRPTLEAFTKFASAQLDELPAMPEPQAAPPKTFVRNGNEAPAPKLRNMRILS